MCRFKNDSKNSRHDQSIHRFLTSQAISTSDVTDVIDVKRLVISLFRGVSLNRPQSTKVSLSASVDRFAKWILE